MRARAPSGQTNILKQDFHGLNFSSNEKFICKVQGKIKTKTVPEKEMNMGEKTKINHS